MTDHTETETGSYELGELEIFWQAELAFEKGEPMQMYLPDGSGYPGSPDTWTLVEIVCTRIEWECSTLRCPRTIERRGMLDLTQKLADQLALQAFRTDDKFEEVICYE